MNIDDTVHSFVFSNAIIRVVAFDVEVLFFDDKDTMALCSKMCRGTQNHLNVIWAKLAHPRKRFRRISPPLIGSFSNKRDLMLCNIKRINLVSCLFFSAFHTSKNLSSNIYKLSATSMLILTQVRRSG